MKYPFNTIIDIHKQLFPKATYKSQLLQYNEEVKELEEAQQALSLEESDNGYVLENYCDYFADTDDFEVIGNIHENPDLLELQK